MKYRTLEPQTWKPTNKNESIEGVLVSKVPRENGNSAKYYISNSDGIHLVWGSAILEERMQFSLVGQMVRITYKGQTKYKDNKLNLYTVEVADLETKEVAAKSS